VQSRSQPARTTPEPAPFLFHSLPSVAAREMNEQYSTVHYSTGQHRKALIMLHSAQIANHPSSVPWRVQMMWAADFDPQLAAIHLHRPPRASTCLRTHRCGPRGPGTKGKGGGPLLGPQQQQQEQQQGQGQSRGEGEEESEDASAAMAPLGVQGRGPHDGNGPASRAGAGAGAEGAERGDSSASLLSHRGSAPGAAEQHAGNSDTATLGAPGAAFPCHRGD